MARVPRITCQNCRESCPALPLTREQYDEIIKQAFASAKEEDKQLAKDILEMRALFVWCMRQQAVGIFRLN